MRGPLVLLGLIAALILLVLLGGRGAEEDGPVPGETPHEADPGQVVPGLRSEHEPDSTGQATLQGRLRSALGTAANAATLPGRVIDAATSGGIPGAVVIAFAPDSEAIRTTKSAEDGAYQLTGLSPGAWWLFVWHRLYVTAGLEALMQAEDAQRARGAMQVEVPVGGGALPERILALGAGRRIEGRVVDADGRPVVGARIRFAEGAWRGGLEKRLGTSLWGWQRYVALSSDADGRFEIACLPPSFVAIRVGAAGADYVSRWSDRISLDLDLPSQSITIVTVPTASVAGHVVHAKGAAAEAVRISTTPSTDYDWHGEWAFQGVEAVASDREGAWTLSGLPPGRVALRADWVAPPRLGVTTGLDPLRPGEVREGVELVVPTRYVLRGRLVDDDQEALAGELLRVRRLQEDTYDPAARLTSRLREQVRTEETGHFELALPHAGPLEIVHVVPGAEDRILLSGHVLPAPDLLLVTRRPQRVEVVIRVEDAAGTGVPRFLSQVIPCRPGGGPDHVNASKSRERGREGVATHRVVPAQPFWLRVTHAKDAQGEELPLGKAWRRVDAMPPDGVVYVVLPADDEICGRIVGPDGNAVPGVRLTLHDVRGGEEAEGRELASIPLQPDGTYSLHAGEWGDLDLRIEVQVPLGWVDVPYFAPRLGYRERPIVLDPAGTLVGRVVAPADLPLGSPDLALLVHVAWSSEAGWGSGVLAAAVDDRGRWKVAGLPLSQDLTVSLPSRPVMRAGYQRPDPLEGVRVGDPEVEIHLVSGLTISGRCTRAGEVPPRSAELRVVARPLDDEGRAPGVATVSADDGRFEITGLAPGAHELSLYDVDHDIRLDTRRCRAGAADVSFHVPEQGTLSIRIAGEATEHIGEVHLWLAGTTELRVSKLHLGSPVYEIDGLPLDETYVVVAQGWDGSVATAAGVKAGREILLEAVESQPLAGRILRSDADETSLSGGLYAVRGDACFHALVYASGEFDFTQGVAPGRYELRYLRDDGTEIVLARDVEAGQEDLELTLP